MQITGKISGISTSFTNGKVNINLEINEQETAINGYEKLKDCECLDIQIDKHREKRSLNANALCWKLCTEIANVLRSDKDTIYLEMLKRYGQSDIVSVLSSVDVSPYFKYYDEYGKGKTNGKDFTHYRVFAGSSQYDTREMSILLDGIVEEAKELGIEVLTTQELSLIKEEWGEYNE